MTRSRIAVVLVAMFTVIALATSLRAQRKHVASLEQWSNQTRIYQPVELQQMNAELHALGLEGWQVTSVIAEPRLDNQKPHYLVFLKKRIS